MPGDTVEVDLASFCSDFMVKVEDAKPVKKVAQPKTALEKKIVKAEAFVAKLSKEETIEASSEGPPKQKKVKK